MEMPKGVRNGPILIPSHDCIGMITMILIQDFLCDEICIECLEPRPRLMLAVRVFGRPST
ncbi:hypothetical protein [Peribacillus frigoritolerans]|uniref:hypothetical protein n=1 Tax=Peribacillus castrilensis TaxID=2897690 RepID=UPI00296E3D3A|nr:hypothetical protein [Peribacillus castrilensis]